MYKVITKKPIAEDSLDHQFPRGCYNLKGGPKYKWEYGHNPYVDEIRTMFKSQKYPKLLDLGCAAGYLVDDALERNFDAIGLEGTNAPLKSQSVKRNKHWKKHKDKRLFLCDITEPFQILKNGKPAKFQIINAWEVLEHLYPERLETVAENVTKHLADDGVFVFSVSPFKTKNQPNLHMSHMVSIDDWHYKVFKGLQPIGPIKGKWGGGRHYIFENRYRGNHKSARKTFWSTMVKK